MSKKEQRVYHYKMDPEGGLWIEGTQLTDPITLKFFLKHLEKDPQQGYLVRCMGELNLVKVEDVPYVVQDLQISEDQIELVFAGNYKEVLDPSTLWVGKENVLYCKVRKGQMEARFNRKSYMELSHYFIQKNKKYYLDWKNNLYEIKC